MAIPLASAVAICSICGEPLNAKGDCLACLLRTGLDESVVKTKPLASLVFGDFEVEQRADGFYWELGHGAMGVTYLAMDKVLRRRVALKVIDVPAVPTCRDLQAVRERFLREARAAAALRHPNVAAVFQFGASSDASHCYYAMELVEGETLETRVRRDGPLKAEPVLEIAIQITRALMAAAAHGLIHRDLKPGNIMLTPGNAATTELEVKVIDFGLAKAIADAGGETDLTHGEFVGTPNFASPEQFGSGPVDARSDIYSLGATLWFALTGLPPHSGSTIEEMHRGQTHADLPVEQLVARKVPEPLVKLLRSTLAVDPSKRPASARELMEALESCRQKLPHGISSFHKLIALIAVVAIAGATLFLLRVNRQKITSAAAGNIAPSAAAVTQLPEKSIAVLPLENLSEEKANAYFADGIQNEILTKLAGIGDLKVISRTSAAKYKSKPEGLKTVARELGVATVLEGSVQRAGDKVRVNVQLLDARDDTHLWAKSYDRDLKDIFTVESEVAQEIADTLRAKLSPSQSDALAKAPTRDTEAYDLFLKGEYEQNHAREALKTELFDRAQTFYRQALAQDPTFALAYAHLAYSRLCQHWFIAPLASAQLAEVKADIERALAIAPALSDGHLALGVFYYWGYRDYDAALKELDRAIELQPSSAVSRGMRASIYRRRGEWKRTLVEFQRAAELNPRDPLIPDEIGATYVLLRRWSDAEQSLKRALAIDPHFGDAAQQLAITYVNSTGDIPRARKMYEELQEERAINVNYSTGNIADLIGHRVYLDVLDRHFADALKAWDVPLADTPDARLRQLEARVGIQVLAAEGAVAGPECEQTRALLEARLAERPEDRNSLIALAWAYVCLGRNADALRVARQAVDSLPIEKDALSGPRLFAALAEIEARTGRPEEAVKILRQLLTAPTGAVISIARLKIDPVWDPIRNNSGFQKLLSEPEPATVYK